jgi:hypothetical protein
MCAIILKKQHRFTNNTWHFSHFMVYLLCVFGSNKESLLADTYHIFLLLEIKMCLVSARRLSIHKNNDVFLIKFAE